MKIWFNDIALELPESITLSELLSLHSKIDGAFAVAVNHTFVPKHAYDTNIHEHDRIDVLIPMQGG